MEAKLISLIKNFNIAGEILSVEPFGSGHINKTYRVVTSEDEYILQQINDYAFKDVDVLMNNINIVTSFIKAKGERTLEVIPTLDNKLYAVSEGKYFRIYKFVQHSVCYQTVGKDLSLASKLGNAFGKFHHLLADLDATKLKEVIVNFHNTPNRFQNFYNTYVSSDETKRKKAKQEIEFILDHENTYSKVYDGLKSGEVKVHTTHNDPKINNILFDEKTNEVLCVIDLDTVMPGSVLYDVGDSFRSLFTGENEDNPDLSLQTVKLDVFKAYISSYLKEMKDDLTKKEIELIPYSIYLLTIECGMRFLEDYLRGNVYFHVTYEEHNLVRSRTQIALAKDILDKQEQLAQIVKEIMEELKHD